MIQQASVLQGVDASQSRKPEWAFLGLPSQQPEPKGHVQRLPRETGSSGSSFLGPRVPAPATGSWAVCRPVWSGGKTEEGEPAVH